MPAPRWLARLNLHLTNRLLSPLAKRLPGMGIVIHSGRKSHRLYRTPVMIFQRGDRLLIALTYGRDSQWVHNVLADDGCDLESRHRMFHLSHPRLLHDEERGSMPNLVRFMLGILNVSDFLEFAVAPSAASA